MACNSSCENLRTRTSGIALFINYIYGTLEKSFQIVVKTATYRFPASNHWVTITWASAYLPNGFDFLRIFYKSL